MNDVIQLFTGECECAVDNGYPQVSFPGNGKVGLLTNVTGRCWFCEY